MSQSLFTDEHLGRYPKDDAKKEGEERAKRLGSGRRIVDEAYVPMYPRFLWLGARLNFVLGQDVACILLCSAALEAALKDFLSKYFRRMLKAQFDEALDEMQIRSLIAACECFDLVDDSAIKMIRTLSSDIRHAYVHSKIQQIARKVEERVEKEEKGTWQQLEGTLREIFVAGMAGEDRSYEGLELLEKVFKAVFQDSEYRKW
jgi:uncharacterized membrane protein YheB (UPF0754 family)